jgi:hypothetical protein
LNTEQRKLYDTIVAHYASEINLGGRLPLQLLLNVDGEAGTGKTFTLLKACAKVQEMAMAVRRVKGGLSRTKARQTQQLLTQTQEETLLKWIKCLTASVYAPSHRILREVADEIHTERCSPSLSNTPLRSYQLVRTFLPLIQPLYLVQSKLALNL